VTTFFLSKSLSLARRKQLHCKPTRKLKGHRLNLVKRSREQDFCRRREKLAETRTRCAWLFAVIRNEGLEFLIKPQQKGQIM